MARELLHERGDLSRLLDESWQHFRGQVRPAPHDLSRRDNEGKAVVDFAPHGGKLPLERLRLRGSQNNWLVRRIHAPRLAAPRLKGKHACSSGARQGAREISSGAGAILINTPLKRV